MFQIYAISLTHNSNSCSSNFSIVSSLSFIPNKSAMFFCRYQKLQNLVRFDAVYILLCYKPFLSFFCSVSDCEGIFGMVCLKDYFCTFSLYLKLYLLWLSWNLLHVLEGLSDIHNLQNRWIYDVIGSNYMLAKIIIK